jgi:M6 family metalloprotease-like protein
MKKLLIPVVLIFNLIFAQPSYADISACKLAHLAQDPPGYVQTTGVGFPKHPDRLSTTGTVTWQVLFVSYPDVPAKSKTKNLYKELIPDFKDYYEKSSNKKLKLKFNVYWNWITLPNPVSSYQSAETNLMEGDRWIKEAVALADGVVDFTKSEALLLLSNPDAYSFGKAWPYTAHPGTPFISADGKQFKNATVITWANNLPQSMVLIHEAGHNFGFIDHRDFVGEYSPMGPTFPLNELLGWEKWYAGWLSDKKIDCINSTKEVTLNPVSDKNGKLAIVPISSTEALVVELRKKQRFDEFLTQPGIIVYKVDSTIKTGEGAIVVLNGQNPVKKKKSISYKNVTVKVQDKNKVLITIS